MATSDNMTTVPAAPITLKPTSAGSRWTATMWTGIGIGSAGLFVTLILILLRCRAAGICKLRVRRRRELRRHSLSKEEDGEQELSLNSLYAASAGETIATRSKAEQRRAELTAGSRCREALKEIYQSKGSYVQMLPWVDDDKRHIMDIYTKLQLEKGDNDLQRKVISYWDIFKLKSKEGHPIIRTILRGFAGLGKTTLLDKIAYDWACGTVAALKKYRLVFVLKMHSLQQTSDVIDALFIQLLDEQTVNREDLKSFITANPGEVLFLLDGFDEFKSTVLDRTKFGSILEMLYRKGEYEKCSVIVTTRPSHYDKLKYLIQRPFALVKVLGFSKDDIRSYVHNFYAQEPSKASGLHERITSSDVLTDLANIPMLLLWMCLLWSESATLPDTMFRLYNQVLLFIFRRRTRISKQEISRLVIAIGKVALDGLLSSDQKLSFQEEDFEPGVLDMAIRAGILTSKRVLKGIDTCISVYFIYKTFQELCAAVYYQSLTSEIMTHQVQMFFGQVSDLARFENLLRFCCGDKEGPHTNSILNMILRKVRHTGDLNDNNLQIALNCYFESQGQALPPSVLINYVIAQNLTADNDLSRDHSTTFMYFLNNVSLHTKGGGSDFLKRITLLRITLSNFLRLGPEFVNCVNRMANLCCVKVTRGLGQSEYLGGWTRLNLLYSLRLKAMKQLQAVGFNGCDLERSSMEHIVGELSDLPNLVELDLSDNETLAGSGWSWSHLGGIQTLNKVDLHHCGLSSDDFDHIAVGLSNLPNLVELNLSYNRSLAGCGRSWSVLAKIKYMRKLSLVGCDLTADDKTQITEAMSQMTNLEVSY